MNIQGKNVILRAIEQKDNDILLKMINDGEMEYMLGGWSFPVSQKNQENWTDALQNERNTLRCVIDVHGEAIGVVMLTDLDYKNGNAEIHIKIANENSRGKGFGTDAIETVVEYAFSELRLKCVYARVSEHNEASLKLFKKCGFEVEGLMKCRLYKKGKYLNVVSLSKIH